MCKPGVKRGWCNLWQTQQQPWLFCQWRENTSNLLQRPKAVKFPPKNSSHCILKCHDNQLFSRLVFPLNRAGYEVKHKLHILYMKMCILTAYIYLGSCFHAQTASPTSALVLGPQCLYQSQRYFSKGFFPLPQSCCRWSKLITGTARHNYKLWLLLSQPAQSDFLAGI